MAVMMEVNCTVCNKTKQESVPNSVLIKTICDECTELAKDSKREKALEDLKMLSMEERVAKIEAKLYDQEQNNYNWLHYENRY